MNIGFYVKNLSNDKQMSIISKIINNSIDNNLISDASIFYDGIGFVPYFISCGMFNSTDLWNFRGNLVVMNADCLKRAAKTVNNIKLIFYYGIEEIDIFSLMFIKSQNIPILCHQKDYQKIYRLTGQNPVLIENENDILSAIGTLQ